MFQFNRRHLLSVLCVALLWLPLEAAVTPVGLRVEYHSDPLGIDVPLPRLSWRLESSDRAQSQSAYQIIVASDIDAIARGLWNTGKKMSSETLHIEYGGDDPLVSRQQLYWKVRVWDADGNESAWSDVASWSMGLLRYSDWKGTWIGYDTDFFVGDSREELFLPSSPYLRTTFDVDKRAVRATLYATAGGLYEMRLNGQKVGSARLTPGWTDYRKRIYYQTYDVLDIVRDGENAIGAILADGWYAGYLGWGIDKPTMRPREKRRGFYADRPSLFAQLEIEYADGSSKTVASGNDWKATTGAVLEADILMGETYDARKEPQGWDEPGFDDSGWDSVRPRIVPLGRLQSHPGVPVEVQERIRPLAISEPTTGTYIFDLGKNIAGHARLQVQGPAGSRVQLRFGEMLHPDGTLLTENLGTARATDTYILKGGEAESWEPRFTYHGFRYVEVTGYPGVPGIDAIEGVRVNSSTPETGSIVIENDIDFGGDRGLVSQLFENVKTTQYANFIDIPTDCPQRDERLGWTADAHIYIDTATYIADVASFFSKWLVDLDDSQLWNGAYPNFAPWPFQFTLRSQFSPGAMDAGVIVPYEIYMTYDDKRILQRFWPSMERFMAFQADQAGDDHLSDISLVIGDWLAIGPQTSKEFIAAAYYAYDANLMAKIAAVLKLDERARHYRRLSGLINAAIVEKYVDDEGLIVDGTQTAYAMSLAMDILPQHLRDGAAHELASLVRENDGRLATGFLGVKHLLPVLSEFGHTELAYQLLTSTKYPSWGFPVANGATSVWERWDGYTAEDGFADLQMNSFNHYAFGSVAEWLFSNMGGITQSTAGYSTISIAPEIGGPFSGVQVSYDSIRGRIGSSWKIRDDNLTLEIQIPANTTAHVRIPAYSLAAIRENGIAVEKIEGVLDARLEGGTAILHIGSGDYTFESSNAAISSSARRKPICPLELPGELRCLADTR